ncbi:MAG TPA: cation:proton antiporter [Thermomicrobiales bacterium]|nr:cation:proton antiporter [Thermomicrobiales bacterium]
MSAELHLLINIAMAIVIALAGGLVAHALRQSVIVGYLLAGMIIGPFTPGFNGDREEIAALAEVGVIFLMFALGIEFSPGELARVKGLALGGTTAQVLLTIGAGVGLFAALGRPLTEGLFFGGIIAMSSTMVILKALLDRGEVASGHGRALLGVLIVQDLAAVVLIVLLPRLAGGGGGALGDLALTLAKALAFIGAVLFLGARVVPGLMARIERLHSAELFLLTAVTLALGAAAASAFLGLSPALGAFLGGLLLGETEFEHRVIAEVVPMRNLFATLFFVSVGMLIDPAFIWHNLPAVVGLALFIMAAKALATAVAVAPFRLGGEVTAFTALGMIQIGEFSYVLARAGREAGAIPPYLNSLILTSSLVTIVLTPGAFWLAPRLGRALAAAPLLGRLLAPALDTPAAPAGGHAVVVGYGRVGRQVADGLRAAGVPLAVIEADLRLVRELAAAGVPAIYGDAASGNVLEAAYPARARLIVVALPEDGATRAVVREARRANPGAPILARLGRAEDDAALRAAGATTLVAPEQAGAALLLEESRRALGLAGLPVAP